MGDLSRIGPRPLWGPAEQAAVDRCLTVPGLDGRVTYSHPARLSRTIETEIIPRLLLAHIVEPTGSLPEGAALTAADVGEFTTVLLERDLTAVMNYVEAVLGRGHLMEAVFLHLLTPTARLLGDMWQNDLCSFADVTIGLSRLQQVLRELSQRFEQEAEPERRGRILLAAVPGEQHSFGLSMLESFFRRAGWDVWGGASHSCEELMRFARDEWIDVVGLSLSSDLLYDQVPTMVRNVRRASRNPGIFVMVGGRFFVDHPDRASEAGADTVATDAPDALRQASSCLGNTLARC